MACSDESAGEKREGFVGVPFVEEGWGGGGETWLAVWVMYWHMYVIVAICRESERPEGTRMVNGERRS